MILIKLNPVKGENTKTKREKLNSIIVHSLFPNSERK